jgi:very-short-patch-repair endonuclease
MRRRARKLRSELSLPEKLLWVRLRGRNKEHPTFRRQHPAGPYVIDFYCATARLCIEVDGISHSMGDRPQRDERRDAYLRSQGIEVVRIPASDVLDDPETVTDWVRILARDRISALTRK